MDKRVEQAAAEVRRAYMREWRRKNPDKVREHNKTYWERKAQRLAEKEAKGDV